MARKVTVRDLQGQLQVSREIRGLLQASLQDERAAGAERVARLQQQLDSKLIPQRIELAKSLSSLVEAVSKAIVYVVGKEQL